MEDPELVDRLEEAKSQYGLEVRTGRRRGDVAPDVLPADVGAAHRLDGPPRAAADAPDAQEDGHRRRRRSGHDLWPRATPRSTSPPRRALSLRTSRAEDEAKENPDRDRGLPPQPAEVQLHRRKAPQGRAAGSALRARARPCWPRPSRASQASLLLDLRLGVLWRVFVGNGRGQGPRPVQAGGGKGALHCVHRRDRYHRQKARRRLRHRRQRRARADPQPAPDRDGRL